MASLDDLDNSSRLVPVQFTSVFDRLPADAPSSHAHIVDLTSFESEIHDDLHKDLKLPDAVATMLFNISEGVLEQFLAGYIKTFKMIQEFAPNCSKIKLIIWRQGCQVLVGQYREYPELDLLEWDNIIGCVINFDGTWVIKEASFGGYTRQDPEEVWTGVFVRTSIDREYPAYDDKSKANVARIIAEYILINECWNAEKGCMWTIKTT